MAIKEINRHTDELKAQYSGDRWSIFLVSSLTLDIYSSLQEGENWLNTFFIT